MPEVSHATSLFYEISPLVKLMWEYDAGLGYEVFTAVQFVVSLNP
jgi:hypothetical protein